MSFNLFWLVLLFAEYLLRSSSNANLAILILSLIALAGLIFQCVSWYRMRKDQTKVDIGLFVTAWILCFLFVSFL